MPQVSGNDCGARRSLLTQRHVRPTLPKQVARFFGAVSPGI